MTSALDHYDDSRSKISDYIFSKAPKTKAFHFAKVDQLYQDVSEIIKKEQKKFEFRIYEAKPDWNRIRHSFNQSVHESVRQALIPKDPNAPSKRQRSPFGVSEVCKKFKIKPLKLAKKR